MGLHEDAPEKVHRRIRVEGRGCGEDPTEGLSRDELGPVAEVGQAQHHAAPGGPLISEDVGIVGADRDQGGALELRCPTPFPR